MEAKDYLNLRFGLQSEGWEAVAFVKNALDTREIVAEPAFIALGYYQHQNKPRSYGVEFTYNF